MLIKSALVTETSKNRIYRSIIEITENGLSVDLKSKDI